MGPFLNSDCLKPLISLMRSDISEEDLKIEIQVSKPFILKGEQESTTSFGFLQKTIRMLLPYRTAFPLTYKLYCTAQTFGASTASCERTFSTLTRILSSNRRSMTQERLKNLTLEPYNWNYLNLVQWQICWFVQKKKRRLQLWTWLVLIFSIFHHFDQSFN